MPSFGSLLAALNACVGILPKVIDESVVEVVIAVVGNSSHTCSLSVNKYSLIMSVCLPITPSLCLSLLKLALVFLCTQ